MTTPDPFTTAARAEGRVRADECGCDLSGMAPPAVHIVDGHPDPVPTAQEPTDAEVEAAAKAIDPAPWRSEHPASIARREDIRIAARAALSAARHARGGTTWLNN